MLIHMVLSTILGPSMTFVMAVFSWLVHEQVKIVGFQDMIGKLRIVVFVVYISVGVLLSARSAQVME